MRRLPSGLGAFLPIWVLVFGLVCDAGIPVVAKDKNKDEDLVDGAIWKFTLKPKNPKDKKEEVRHGAIRVNGNKLYQRDGDDEKFTKLVGTKEVLAKSKTRLTFTDLSLDRGKIKGVKGKAEIHGDEPGVWSGVFVDDEDVAWTVKFTRTQE